MGTVLPSLPLTSVAAADVQQQLVNILKTAFPDWTDTQASNNMIVFLEILSAVQELDYAYINRLAREAFIQYALDYRNVVAHAKALGYTPSYQSPSTVDAIITSASAVTAATTVPAGTRFNSNLQGVYYETTGAVTIPNGSTQTPIVSLAQQVSQTDTYTGTDAPNQQVTLNQNPVLPTTLTVTVNGVLWAYVQNFVESIATDQVYTWSMDPNGVCTVQFGDGISGSLIPAGANVTINYKTGGGSQNAIGPNALTTCISDVHDGGNGTLLSLSAYNALASVPGGDAETTAQIKVRAPLSARTPRCLLTLDDIQNAVNALPGVFSSIAASWQQISSLPRYMVEVFVAPVGLGTPSPELITEVNTLLTVTKPLVMGQTPVITGPTYVPLNFNIQVFAKTGYNQNAVQNAVSALLQALFNNTDATQYNGFVVGFGVSIYMSVIAALIQQLPGVRNVVILAPGDTLLTINQFPTLGSINFAATA